MSPYLIQNLVKINCVFCHQSLDTKDLTKLKCSCEYVHTQCVSCIFDTTQDFYYTHFCTAYGKACYQYLFATEFCCTCQYFLQIKILDTAHTDVGITDNGKIIYIKNMTHAQEYFSQKQEKGLYKNR